MFEIKLIKKYVYLIKKINIHFFKLKYFEYFLEISLQDF